MFQMKHQQQNMFSIISKEIGPVDILVNNAGVSGPASFLRTLILPEFSECVMIHFSQAHWDLPSKCIENMEKGF